MKEIKILITDEAYEMFRALGASVGTPEAEVVIAELIEWVYEQPAPAQVLQNAKTR